MKTKNQRSKKTLAFVLGAIALVGAVAALIVLNRGETSASYTPVSGFPDVHGLAVDPNDPQILYVGTHHGLVRGRESEGRWSWALVGSYRADFMGFSMHPNGKVFYASGHKVPDAPLMGVARSEDGGFSWKIIALRGIVDFHTMAISWANPDVLYGWYYGDRRLYRSADGGKTWRNPAARSLSDVLALATDPIDENIVWAATEGGLWRSTDGGESFALISFTSTPVLTVAVDPTNPQVLYASLEAGVRRSTDGGQSWESVGEGMGEMIGYLAISPANADLLYAATYSAAIYRSTDAGLSWSLIKPDE